jgi:hypothetical protein
VGRPNYREFLEQTGYGKQSPHFTVENFKLSYSQWSPHVDFLTVGFGEQMKSSYWRNTQDFKVNL